MTLRRHQYAPPSLHALRIATAALVLLAGCGGGSLLQAPVSAERPSPATPAPTPSATATATTATPPWQSIESGDWAIANGGLRNTRARDGGFDPDAGESLTAA